MYAIYRSQTRCTHTLHTSIHRIVNQFEKYFQAELHIAIFYMHDGCTTKYERTIAYNAFSMQFATVRSLNVFFFSFLNRRWQRSESSILSFHWYEIYTRKCSAKYAFAKQNDVQNCIVQCNDMKANVHRVLNTEIKNPFLLLKHSKNHDCIKPSFKRNKNVPICTKCSATAMNEHTVTMAMFKWEICRGWFGCIAGNFVELYKRHGISHAESIAARAKMGLWLCSTDIVSNKCSPNHPF